MASRESSCSNNRVRSFWGRWWVVHTSSLMALISSSESGSPDSLVRLATWASRRFKAALMLNVGWAVMTMPTNSRSTMLLKSSKEKGMPSLKPKAWMHSLIRFWFASRLVSPTYECSRSARMKKARPISCWTKSSTDWMLNWPSPKRLETSRPKSSMGLARGFDRRFSRRTRSSSRRMLFKGWLTEGIAGKLGACLLILLLLYYFAMAGSSAWFCKKIQLEDVRTNIEHKFPKAHSFWAVQSLVFGCIGI